MDGSETNKTHTIKPVILNPAAIAATPVEGFSDSTGGNVTWKTLFSSPNSPTNTFTTGIARCNPKGGYLQLHRHKQAEIYHVTHGHGIVSIEGVEYPVEKGTVLFIPGDAEHGIRNTNEREELVWLYVFATDKFEDVVYRFKKDGNLKSKL
ncbi:RmlC-like cupin [Lindgomyces ingoldianus]|uniref:RmlC-like cupin n=1 Tax=Lindgomyces ingoldianus TaxID=673940 RepID=A0ACB6QID9_9PLEO|nr:RmlC-like cupin [Lindgomyces ingoldianus]KAF2466759.1 RmlC-like cupin [Lindgomyces ingoldianus]